MAHTKQALKRARQNERIRVQERAMRADMRTHMKALEAAMAAKDAKTVAKLARVAQKKLDKAAKQRVHPPERGLAHQGARRPASRAPPPRAAEPRAPGERPPSLRSPAYCSPSEASRLLKVLHIMNADGSISADMRRKLNQVNHLVELFRPVLTEIGSRRGADPRPRRELRELLPRIPPPPLRRG